jgi:RNA polymerase sigma factor (TIGR02999 family)
MSENCDKEQPSLPPSDASGPKAAVDGSVLLPLVYDELRQLARFRMSQERTDHTMQATALVHEAYLRIAARGPFVNRGQFFYAAAQAMRYILIEHARMGKRVKRGGGLKRVPANVLDLAAVSDEEDILALDDAIERLSEQTPQVAAVVRLRFYGGLSIEETAEALGISPRTVNREWTYARAWLFQQLDSAGEPGSKSQSEQ